MTTHKEALTLALEALEGLIKKTGGQSIYSFMETERRIAMSACVGIKEALTQPPVPTAQPKESNKDGSPCPEFWDWLPKAYNFEGDGNFTKYNMEVAFLAGKQAAQPKEPAVPQGHKQEPVACVVPHGATMRLEWASVDAAHNAKIGPLYTTPPQRKPLTDEEIGAILEGVNAYGTRLYTFARAIEAKLKEKNT